MTKPRPSFDEAEHALRSPRNASLANADSTSGLSLFAIPELPQEDTPEESHRESEDEGRRRPVTNEASDLNAEPLA
jgi:hypothetical protein